MKRTFFLRLFLCSALLVLASSFGLADDLDDAMQGYLNSIIYGDQVAFLSCFSKTDSWRFVSYRAGTGKVISDPSMTYEETEAALMKKGGFYTAFFVGMPQYRYRDRIAAHPLSTWIRTDEQYRIPEEDGNSFVHWRKEGKRWVIMSIGDDAP